MLLVATRTSGSTTVLTISRSQSGAWDVQDSLETTDGSSNPIQGGSVVIDTKGNPYKADRSGLAVSLASGDVERKRSIWISAGAKGVKCVGDITGERLGKTEWGSKVGKVEQVAVVRKNSKFCISRLPICKMVDVSQLQWCWQPSLINDKYLYILCHTWNYSIPYNKNNTLSSTFYKASPSDSADKSPPDP